MKRRSHINSIALLLIALILCAPATSPGSGRPGRARQDRCRDGIYSATVRGYYTGTGIAEVLVGSVRIDAEITSETGQTGRVRGTFPTSGAHFSGQGTIMREAVTIRGRVDAAKASRLVATFWDSSGHAGRVIAILPTDPGDDTWDDAR